MIIPLIAYALSKKIVFTVFTYNCIVTITSKGHLDFKTTQLTVHIGSTTHQI